MFQDKRFILPEYTTPKRSHHMRAEGNLTYLGFIRLLEEIWKQSHPKIPFVAIGGPQNAKYPCIVYSLKLRRPFQNESKPLRQREEIFDDNNKRIIITTQRFTNIIAFTATTENNPYLAEELIEAFEDFMFQMVGVFKRLGISDMFYARRLPDDEESRPGEDVCRRTLTWMVVTEKVYQTDVAAIEDITIYARKYIEGITEDSATPSSTVYTQIVDEYSTLDDSATPNT